MFCEWEWECEHAASERELVDLRTVTRIRPSSPTSACSPGSTTMEAMLAAVSGNCSVMSIRAPRYSNMKSMSVYQMMHCSTTICTMRLPENSPYMPLSNGIPMTSVLGSVESEKSVMVHSRLPRRLRWLHAVSMASTISFCSVSAAMNRRFIVYGLLVEMKWNDSSGTANSATKRLIPEHWSGVKMRHHFTDPYASIIATYNGTIAVITW
uniref:Uncharacterized protein n=1 Tax=Oryza brachyantha TaxID=4533 RepID=J3LH03_ORYBR